MLGLATQRRNQKGMIMERIQFQKLLSLALSVTIIGNAAPIQAAPAMAISAVREPLIEVSVDSLEITETNSSLLGILWGQASNPTGGSINFIERTVPSLFSIGQLDRQQIAGQLDAQIKNGQIRVLANPTLLTKSGFEANFLVGGEIPYPQVGQGGVSGVDYKKYGVSLKIMPTLTPRGTVDAQINVNVSNPDQSVGILLGSANGGTFIPGIASREAGTKVEVKDGETVVLAGIKQSRREKTIVRVPIVGYIPILGLLFRHKEEHVTQTSLVFFVTFRLVKN
jgi:pilus assembly protein CpaC